MLDGAKDGSGRSAQVVSLQVTRPEVAQQAAAAIRGATGGAQPRLPLAARLVEPKAPKRGTSADGALAQAGAEPPKPPPRSDGPPPEAGPPGPQPGVSPDAAQPGQPSPEPKPGEDQRTGLINPVQIEMLEGLDVLVIRGNTADVEQVMEIIKQIERLSAETEPAIEVLPLRHVDCQAMGVLVRSLYDEVYPGAAGQRQHHAAGEAQRRC